jgi:YfiH family protein
MVKVDSNKGMILPPTSASFHWVETAAGPALVCEPLDSIAPHLFTTRSWRLGRQDQNGSTETGWDDVASALGVKPEQLVRVSQVHGAGVSIARQPGDSGDADIVLSDDSGLAVGIRVADCVPLLIADRRTGAVAAAHAGWRGLASRVPGVTVRAMHREYGCDASDLVAAIGPAIGSCCYEVGPSVFDRFSDAGFDAEDLDRWFSPTPQASAANPSLPTLDPGGRPGRWFFDGWASARDQLLAAGLASSQVFSSDLCTASHPAVFCSYRRDGKGAGRLAAVIRRRPPRPSPHSPDDRHERSTRDGRAQT